jgi:tryptophan halogenase
LDNRRGVGHVFSSDHTDPDAAERVLRGYVGKAGDGLDIRHIKFEAGYREISWRKNCVAIGLSSGFFEPLEAHGHRVHRGRGGHGGHVVPLGRRNGDRGAAVQRAHALPL